ncbi:hypothetical protein Tco_0654731 [Tanacetum coccineum]|uniref:Uncharacterized protein n=1 Tax=Tanacetum coccineum TaxID=301880 RepID=A0ABQ4X4B1_9ASTR
MILQDTLQVSLAEHKSREEQEARENVALVDEHLASKREVCEIDGTMGVEPGVIKESSSVRDYYSIRRDNVNDEDELLGRYGYLFALYGRASCQGSIDVHLLDNPSLILSMQCASHVRLSCASVPKVIYLVHILSCHPAQSQTSSVPDQQYQLYLAMKDCSLYDAHPEGENSAKAAETSGCELMSVGESSVWRQVLQEDKSIHQTSGTLWMNVCLTIDEAISWRKVAVEMLRQRCTQEIRIKRTSRWVNKCVRKFNPYARYGVEHWKNPHAKIFYIRKQKEPGKPKEERLLQEELIDLTKDEAEYLKLFEEEIEERLKHRRQMRRWEMFVNGRPLGPRRERPE